MNPLRIDLYGVLERAVKLKINNTWSEWDLIFLI